MLIRIVAVLAVFAYPAVFSPAVAEEAKISVAVNHSGEDTVGQKLAFALRETIRSSSGYQLISGPKATYRISLVTLDPESSPSAAGRWTVAAVTFTMKNTNPFNDLKPQTWYAIYLTTLVVTAGSRSVDEQAKSLLAALESQIEAYRSDLRQK